MDILEELKKREPLFHHPEYGTGRADFENMTDVEFWEIGASGQYYSRVYVIDTLIDRYKDPNYINEDCWEAKDFHCLEIAKDNYLLTYVLIQGKEKRLTRRATIWRRVNTDWKILYHQGTLIQE